MHAISVSAMRATEPVIHVRMAYDDFVRRFGPAHSTHPPDWDAPGPVELWFFELPWGHRILLQFHLGKAFFHISWATNLPCRKEDSFGERRLAGINVGKNCDIANRLKHLGPYFVGTLRPSKSKYFNF